MGLTFSPSEILVDPSWIADHLTDPSICIADCRYRDDEREAHVAYLSGHLPGAVHVFWPRDLAAGTTPVTNLLPSRDQAAARLSALGIGNDTTVVAYDDDGGHHAARLWLVLAYFGHDQFKLLNGGVQRWQAEGRPLATDEVSPAPAEFTPGAPREELRIRADELARRLDDPGSRSPTCAPRENMMGRSCVQHAAGGSQEHVTFSGRTTYAKITRSAR